MLVFSAEHHLVNSVNPVLFFILKILSLVEIHNSRTGSKSNSEAHHHRRS